jgi:hypothetical protein
MLSKKYGHAEEVQEQLKDSYWAQSILKRWSENNHSMISSVC